MPRRGFSLIELLVVVSIIAILAALLLPTMGLVRDTARSSRCGASLRQMQMANIAYAIDWDGFYVPICKYLPGPGLHNWWPSNADFIDKVTGGQTGSEAKVAPGFLCPVSRPVNGSGNTVIGLSFGMNDYQYWSWPPPETFPGFKVGTLRRPAEKVAFVDALGKKAGQVRLCFGSF
jgi:prepilin-type N-terminal cleavage/methylation domain-containing protein